jgi:hypothetical protein
VNWISLAVNVTLVLAILASSASAWQIETVDTGVVGAYSSLKVDAADGIHISHFAGSVGHLKYARFNGLTWANETVDGEYLTGHSTSLDLDSQDRPCIAYRFYSGRCIRLAAWTGASWTFTQCEQDADMEDFISMALDGEDRAHIAYHEGTFYGEASDLKYARYDGASWTTEIVDAPGRVGRGSSLALDSAGRPHIAYFDETNATLKYARFDGSGWVVTTIDDVEYIAFNFRTAIAIDSQDRVHIAYSAYHYEAPDWFGRLKHARNDGGTWQIEIVDEAAPTRDFRIPAIALDADDVLHVSYLLYFNVETYAAQLRYARPEGSSWHIEVIDTGMADSEHSNSIDLDAAGRPHVSYASAGHTLMHAVGEASAGVASELRAPRGLVLLPPAACPSREPQLRFWLASPADVRLDILDPAGRRVWTAAPGAFPAGRHTLPLGVNLTRGVYFCRFAAGSERAAQQLVVQ